MYYDENKLHTNNLIKEENIMNINILANLAKNAGYENLLIESDIVEESTAIINSLDVVEESVLTGDISVLPVYESDESYFIDLESLNTVAEVYDVELNEAMNLIKEVNDLSENSEISVVLKEGFENYMTLENFINLKEALDEAGINLAWDKEISSDSFITEANIISDSFNKIKSKLKNMKVESLEKSIKTCEESNKKLNEELQKVEKMSKEDAEKYVKKQSYKNLAITSAYTIGAGVAGGANGYLIAFKPLIGLPLYLGLLKGVTVTGNKIRLSGKAVIGFNVNTYKKAIKNTIKINNQSIKECNKAIKSKK